MRRPVSYEINLQELLEANRFSSGTECNDVKHRGEFKTLSEKHTIN